MPLPRRTLPSPTFPCFSSCSLAPVITASPLMFRPWELFPIPQLLQMLQTQLQFPLWLSLSDALRAGLLGVSLPRLMSWTNSG